MVAKKRGDDRPRREASTPLEAKRANQHQKKRWCRLSPLWSQPDIHTHVADTQSHKKTFNDAKDLISKPPVLTYYDVTKPVTFSCELGLWAACLQDVQPVAFPALTQDEIRYAQIETEMLAIVFACHKFHDFIFSRKAIVKIDHQPLVSILMKPLHSATMRLQKMVLNLQPYDIELVYKKGTDIPVMPFLEPTSSTLAVITSSLKITKSWSSHHWHHPKC